MTTHVSPGPQELNTAIEDETRRHLRQLLSATYQDRVDSYIENLLAIDHYASRFQYLYSVVGGDILRPSARILISGFGAGSEMIAAKRFGFSKVYGVEVELFWVKICQRRLRDFPEMYPVYYEGNCLPFADGQFELVASGHIIEHTRDPLLYLRECLRVMKPNGYLSLEFPNRYHYIELHTQLPSLEWLPRPVRNNALRLVSSKLSPLNAEVKSRYASIVSTNLQQVSLGSICRMLKRTGYSHCLLDLAKPAPGIIRCVIQKDG